MMALVIYGAVGPKGQEQELARRLLQTALAREYGLETVPTILRMEKGKPYFPEHPAIHFNLSHSHGAAVCALSSAPVGVDVEVLRAAPRRLAAGRSDIEFFRLWTAQEAAVKLSGEGLAVLMKRSALDQRCRILEDFLPGCIVAVCPEDADTQIRTIPLNI